MILHGDGVAPYLGYCIPDDLLGDTIRLSPSLKLAFIRQIDS